MAAQEVKVVLSLHGTEAIYEWLARTLHVQGHFAFSPQDLPCTPLHRYHAIFSLLLAFGNTCLLQYFTIVPFPPFLPMLDVSLLVQQRRRALGLVCTQRNRAATRR